MDQITIPYLAHDAFESLDSFMMRDEDRFKVLARLFEQEGLSLDDCPEAHKQGPMSAWCWLILKVNNIEPEYFDSGNPYPLTHYGIDLSFSETPVRKWIWFIA